MSNYNYAVHSPDIMTMNEIANACAGDGHFIVGLLRGGRTAAITVRSAEDIAADSHQGIQLAWNTVELRQLIRKDAKKIARANVLRREEKASGQECIKGAIFGTNVVEPRRAIIPILEDRKPAIEVWLDLDGNPYKPKLVEFSYFPGSDFKLPAVYGIYFLQHNNDLELNTAVSLCNETLCTEFRGDLVVVKRLHAGYTDRVKRYINVTSKDYHLICAIVGSASLGGHLV
ncbi:hypothetical protein BJ138DRAFT_1105234 [Hygrophoropsis aurantiaca]|uniref:Uncharacterized protein n=1 Tax=Hygrophoropsis aurantiaca TaxID=72124 RepID=A0ACB7ZZM0_9AGAM|nr:hypothetical protein BJ138DRAFT_1105234 [Hygrophoropsis aurantiaca]